MNPLYKLQIDKKVRGAVFWGVYVVTKFILQPLHIFIVLHRLSICHSHFKVFL